ncbi:MAG: ribonuclease III [Anaerolineales bacterium]
MTPEEFLRQLGLSFKDPSLLRRALTHRSYLNENPEAVEDNERLEFLGDAALDFVTAGWLYHRYPEMDEGALTRLRSALVRTEQLAEFAQSIELGEALLLGRGEVAMGGRQRPAILCATFEALIGAMYIDSGVNQVIEFMEPRLSMAAKKILESEKLIDARSVLQMWAQGELGVTPKYETVDAFGPDHAREFIVEVRVGKKITARGQGHSKQEAAQRAATAALKNVHPNEIWGR